MEKIVFVQTNGTGTVTLPYPSPSTKNYAAISYRWGQGLPSWQLQTRDYLATVSAFYNQHFNLLLTWINTTLKIPYVWIDAICIDQSSAEDKARQLGEITRLFHNAKAVVAAPWLAHCCHDDITQIYGGWTSRCWVAAEIHSAEVIHYTSWNWDEECMRWSTSQNDREGFCPPGADPDMMNDEEKAEHRRMSDLVVILRKGRHYGQFHIDEIAKIAVELDAEVEGDKLYALLPTTGAEVPRCDVQMDLEVFVGRLMQTIGQIDRMRLVMGVSRFRDPTYANMSWAFGKGAEYRAPWATDEYLNETGGASVELNEDWSLTIDAQYHTFELERGDLTTNSEYYWVDGNDCIGDVLFYHPRIDEESVEVVLISCGLDFRERVVGIMVDCESKEKIGIFMLQRQRVGWGKGPNIVR